MSIAQLHYLHGVLFPGAQFLSQLGSAAPATNLDELIAYGSGHPDPLFVGTKGGKPDIPISSTQLKTLLDLCGSSFIADLSAGNTDLFYKKAADLGVRQLAASTVHTRIRMSQGAFYWDTITAEHQGEAELSGRIVPTWDGTNAILIPAGSIALSGTPTAAEQYTLGPVKLNGSFIPGIARWSLGLQTRTKEAGDGGEDAITFFGIEQRQPVLEVMSDDIDAWVNYGISGLALTSLVFYLRAKTLDGVNVANGTPSHISFTATNGKVCVANSSGGGNNTARQSLKIYLRASSASANVLAINTATTIT